MGDLIVIIILILIIGGAAYKLYLDKKNNVMCSGCPSYKACSSNVSCTKTLDENGNPIKESIVILKKSL